MNNPIRTLKVKIVGVDSQSNALTEGKIAQREENYTFTFNSEDYLACKRALMSNLKNLERSRVKDAGQIAHTSRRAHEIERAWVRGSYMLVKCGH